MNRFSKAGAALLAGIVILLGGAQAATASAPARPTALTIAQANALAAQTPPAMIGGKPAITSKVAKPVTSPAPVMGLKGKPGKPGGLKALTTCAPACYYYGVGKQTLDPNAGPLALYGIFAPPLGSHGYHSLAEAALQSADEQQIIEVGWTVDNTGVNGADHTNPHIFAASWRNGAFQGYNGGSGWINYSGRTYTVGDSLSGAVNTERTFGIQYNAPIAPATKGRWWVSHNQTWMGSFDEASWTTGPGAIASFNHGGLAQMFGETAQDVDEPCAMMGNGTLGNATSGGAAPAAGPARINSTTYANWPSTSVNLTVGSTSALQPTGNVSASHRSFTYGGPQKTTGLCV